MGTSRSAFMGCEGSSAIMRGLLGVASLVMAGCATKGDLDTLKQEIQTSVTTSKTEVEQKIAPLVSQMESLKGETKAGFETTKKQIEERERQLAQDLKTQQEALAKLSEEVKGSQGKIAEQIAKQEALSKETAGLRSAISGTNRAVLEFLKAEEARLKDSLRWVQSALKELAAEEKPK